MKLPRAKLFSFLLLVLNLNCIGIPSAFIGDKVDSTRERIFRKEVCGFDDIKNSLNYESKKYFYTLKRVGSFGDFFLGMYGVYATYPNGLLMFGSFLYGIIAPVVTNHGDQVDFISQKNENGWLSQNKICKNSHHFFIHHELVEIELNPTLQENNQLSTNTSKEILNQFCIDKTKEFDEKLFSKVEESVKKEYSYEKFYEKEWYYKKYKKKKNPNTKLNFKKYVLNSEFNVQSKLQKNSKNNFENQSVNHLSCELEYIIEYKGGSIQFFWDNFEEVK